MWAGGTGLARLRRGGALVFAAHASFALFVLSAGCYDAVEDTTGLFGRGTHSDPGSITSTGISHSSSGNEVVGVDTPDDEPPAGTFVPGRVLVKFKAGASDADKQRSLGAANARASGEIPHIGVKIIELPQHASEKAQARAFAAQALVEFAELDRIVQLAGVPNDPFYLSQWHLAAIGCPQAWDMNTGNSSVIIAILDTGVDGMHPDLTSNLVPGWNFYDNSADTSDVNGHGTAVAGTAAASSNNGLGVAAPASGCAIMPLRVSYPSGCAAWSTIDTALVWAADHGARVANISYPYTFGTATSSAAQYFQSRGGVVTASAGNDAVFDATTDNPFVLTIGATQPDDGLAPWSNTGNNIDLAAPGVNIFTTAIGGLYGSASGTSYSSPLVAGVAALALSTNPAITTSQVQDILKQSADDLGPAGWDPGYGWGRVNAARAVALAAAIVVPPADTTPPTESFVSPLAGATVSGTVAVQVSASDNVGVASVSLYVDGNFFASTTLTPYSFAWNTTGLADGMHGLEARASDGAGNAASANISVSVRNVFADTTPPVIVITSPISGATVRATVSVMVNTGDNVGVSRVELYVDGVIKSTATTAPFTTTWSARRASSGSHSLYCKAYDAVGNAGQSTPVTVYK